MGGFAFSSVFHMAFCVHGIKAQGIFIIYFKIYIFEQNIINVREKQKKFN